MPLKLRARFIDFRDRLKTKIRVKKENFFILAALIIILIAALLVRLSPIFVGPELIKAFDPWLQYYNANYLAENGVYEYFHWHDFKSWYPEGTNRYELRPGLTFTIVIIYNILNGLGIPIDLYHVCYYFPAYAGTLTVLIMYFLGKEILDKRTGLIAAFFLAFNPGHMQRTVAGFFDNETIGILGTLLTFLFFIKAVKTGKFHFSIFAGMALGYLALSWGGYVYSLLIVPLLTGILVIIDKYSPRLLIAYCGTEGTGIFLYSLFVKYRPEHIFDEFEFFGVFLFSVVLIVFHLFYRQKTLNPKFYSGFMTVLRWSIIPIILIGAIILWISPNILPFGFDQRFFSVFSPLLRQDIQLVASVAEHMPSPWSVFYYNTLIPSLLVPAGIFFCLKRGNEEDYLIVIYILTLFYFTGSMIRIILLFAPAVALIGSYGLSNLLKIFGTFIGKQKAVISRRRKRQIKSTIGSWEAFGVYALVGFLMFAQVSHATDVTSSSLAYSQIAPGNQIHDWEESLTWMRTNLDPSTVVVSWWDYGYWLTPIGNVTTINDNGTMNQTRIGATGMSFMLTDEIESAKILRHLKADYILVFFGVLINGLGGDEGKWPWMLRICNDNFVHYERFGWRSAEWKENTVFDEAEYHNQSTGRYEDKWFDSTLVELMFYGLATELQDADPNKPYQAHYTQQIAGNPSQNIEALVDDNGNTWSSHIPYHGYYDFKVFKKEYFSYNGLVKLFKIDYTALDSSFEIREPAIYENGFATLKVANTGLKNLTVDEIFIEGTSYNYDIENNDKNIAPDEDRLIWVDSRDAGWELSDAVNITVSCEAQAFEDDIYTFQNSTPSILVEESPEYEIKINRENSIGLVNASYDASFYIEVENTGEGIVNLNTTYVNAHIVNVTDFQNNNSLLKPGEKRTMYIPESPIGKGPFKESMDVLADRVMVTTFEGTYDETIFAYNKEDYKISIISQERVVSEELKLFNLQYKSYIPIDLNSACAYDNGSIFLKVKNTGSKLIGLDSVYVEGESKSFVSLDGDYLLSKNEIKIIKINYPDAENNDPVEVIVAASGLDGYIAATDAGDMTPISDSPSLDILTEDDLMISSNFDTEALANELIQITVKNTGNSSIDLVNVELNGTETISINNVVFSKGSKTLDLQDISIFTFNVSQLKLNKSNNLDIRVTTNTSADAQESIEVEVPIGYSLNIKPDPDSYADNSSDIVSIVLQNLGVANLTVDGVYLNETYISWGAITIKDGEDEVFASGEEMTLEIDLSDVAVILGESIEEYDVLEILIITIEGAEDTYSITVRA